MEDGWNLFVIIGYVIVDVAFTWSMNYSINGSMKRKDGPPDTAQKIVTLFLSVTCGVFWPITLPAFAFAVMFLSAGRR